MVKVLLVDDEPDFIEFIRPMVEELGLQVLLANSGRKALKIFDLESPDILVTDIVMPIMNGVELIEAVSEKEKVPTIITISGHPDWDEKLKKVAASISVSLLKPTRVGDLLDSIDICLTLIEQKKNE